MIYLHDRVNYYSIILFQDEKIIAEEVTDNVEKKKKHKDKTDDKVKKGPKKRKMKPTKHRIRECGVEIENLSTQTISYYYGILKSKKGPKPKEDIAPTAKIAGS